MKKKIFIGAATGMLVMFTVLSVNVSQKSSDNMTLKSIKIMSQANAEVNPKCPTGCVEKDDYCYCNDVSSYHWAPPEGKTL